MTFTSSTDRARAAAPTQKLTDQQIDTMRKWRKAGQSYKQLSWFFNVSVNSVRYHCDVARQVRRNEEKQATLRRSEILGPGNMQSAREIRKIDYEAMRLKREIPKDTRSLTARLCGDPLSGRSALDSHGQTEGTQ